MDTKTNNIIINPAQQVHGQEEIDAATQAIQSGRWAEGPWAAQFRRKLSKYLGVRYVTLTNSGSSANLAAIMALTTQWIDKDRRLLPKHEVITPALCFPTTVSPIYYARAIPTFVDVDDKWSIDIKQVEDMIGPKTRALMFAHNLGNPSDMDAIMELAERHRLWVIEDNCDCLGGEWEGQRTGSIGDIGTSSFYPAHQISVGEGGAVYTNDPILHRAITSIVNWGRECWCAPGCDNTCGIRYEHQLGGLPHGYDHKNTFSEMGFNLKGTDISAALGVEQMKRLPGFVKTRRKNHAFLKGVFANYEQWFDLPTSYPQSKPSWFGYVVKLKPAAPFLKDDMVKYLEEYGIQSRAFFCGNITRQPVLWKKSGYRVAESFEVSNDIMMNAFWIGVHPAIGKKERAHMKNVITNFLDRYI